MMTEQDDRTRYNPEEKIKMILDYCANPRSIKEIMEYVGLKHRPTLIYNYINPLMKDGKLKQTIPDKPTSSNQKYVTVINNKMEDKGESR